MSKEKKPPKSHKLELPSRIAGNADLIRTIRELEKIDDFLYQTRLRMPGRPVTLPKSSKMLDELAEVNGVSLLAEKKRKNLLESLEGLLEKSPTIHISFASEPSNDFLQNIVGWSRKNIHPYSLINVGLQPSVIVGCEVRTTNKVFDLSLRNKFGQMREVLIKKLEESSD